MKTVPRALRSVVKLLAIGMIAAFVVCVAWANVVGDVSIHLASPNAAAASSDAGVER